MEMKITLEQLTTFIKNFMTADVLHAAALSKKELACKEWIRGGLRGIANIDTEDAKIACTEILKNYNVSKPAEFETLVSSVCDKNASFADKDRKIDELIEKVFSLGGEDALAELIRAMWKGINKLDAKNAAEVGKHTCICYEVMEPPGWQDVINSVYDKSNPDVDMALTIQGYMEYMAAEMNGDRFSIDRKGNIATIVMAESICLCPFSYEYHIIDPSASPAQCNCIPNLYPKAYLRLYGLPIKARAVETIGRGGRRCVAELEFPEELIKTPEFHFP